MKRTIVTPAPPRSFQPWGAGAEAGRGQEEWRRDRQKGKERDSQKDRGAETNREEKSCERRVPGKGVGGCGGRELWRLRRPQDSVTLAPEHLLQPRWREETLTSFIVPSGPVGQLSLSPT